jgi:hypothetical protein
MNVLVVVVFLDTFIIIKGPNNIKGMVVIRGEIDFFNLKLTLLDSKVLVFTMGLDIMGIIMGSTCCSELEILF